MNDILTKDKFNNAYPLEKQRFILGMLKEFKLCYEPNREIYIPATFPDTNSLLDFKDYWDNSIKLTLQYDIIQNSIIEKFIVEAFPYRVGASYWRSGIVIEYGGTRALVEAVKESNRIEVLIKNPDKEIIVFIKNIFDKIHNNENIKVKFFVELPDESKV